MDVRYASVGARELNDDRVVVDRARGLYVVCDASGPTYGGYYAPFAIDSALDALVRAFDETGPARERLVRGVEAAHAEMSAMHGAYERARAGRVGLEAAREAADAIRPAAWRGVASLAHFGASVTACAVSSGAIVIAHVGVCHLYALGDGPELLVRDDSVASVIEASGSDVAIDDALRNAPARVLGMGDLQLDIAELDARSPLVLCTDGAWSCARAVPELFEARSNDDVRLILERAQSETRDDATAVVLRFDEEEC